MSALHMRELAIDQAIEEEEELDAAQQALLRGQADVASEHLARARILAQQRALKIPIAKAARLLGVSEPTVRAWADAGTLQDVPGKPRALTLASVYQVRERLSTLRSMGRSKQLRAALLARIEDSLTLSDPQVRKSLEQMRDGRSKHYVGGGS